MGSADPFEHTAGVWRLSRDKDLSAHPTRHAPDPRVHLGWLEAMRRSISIAPPEVLRDALQDEAADVRLYALRWIADERIVELREAVAELLAATPSSPQYYLAVLAALDWLDHEPTMRDRAIADELLLRELRNKRRPPAAQALALRLLSPESSFLSLKQLRQYLATEYVPLRLEAVRSLAMKSDPKCIALLAEVAADKQQDERVRVEAIAGLAAEADDHRDLLEKVADKERPALQREAERALRLAGMRPMPQEEKPPADNVDPWVELLRQNGDSGAGRRLFFSGAGPRCGVCHQHSGRGGRIGPDLTHFGGSASRERIITSILQPSQEIAPHYQPWTLITGDGKTLTGLRLPKAGDDGVEEYADAEGKRFSLKSDAIELREPSDVSIMPEGLEKVLSLADLRDLVAFLDEGDQLPAAGRE